MSKPTKTQKRRLSALWHALKFLAGKEANTAARDLLKDGESFDVRLDVSGMVGNVEINERIAGTLSIGHEQTKASAATPDYVGVVAHLLEQMPGTRREALLTELPKHYTANGSLPEVTDERTSQAKSLLEQLRSRKTTTARGAVHFARTEG